MTANVENAKVLVETKAVVTLEAFAKSVQNKGEVPMVWIQWECTDRSLPRRAIQLADKLMQIAGSKRLDPKQLAVGFINSQHGADTQAFMDEFVLYNANNGGEIEFRVIPYRKDAEGMDRAYVFHKSMGWRKPLFRGRWPDLRKWFNTYDPENPEGKPAAAKTPQKGVRTAGQVPLPKTVKFRKEETEEEATA